MLVCAALAVLVGRLLWDSRAAVRAGDDAERRGDHREACRRYLDAARLYVPGSPFVRRALDALEDMAETAQKAGDLASARQALEAMRAALLGTRSFYTPHAERLPRIDGRLARLYALLEDAQGSPGGSPAARQAWHAERLSRRPGPAAVPVLLVFVGLALWLGAAVAFVAKGLDAGLRLRTGPAIASGVVFLLGFTLFVAALRLA